MQHLLIIDFYSNSILRAVKKLHEQPKYRDLTIIILSRSPRKYAHLNDNEVNIEVLQCSFSSDEEVARVLAPIRHNIVAVTCRGDKQVQFLRMALPHLPKEVLVATDQALEITTNKRLMRESFEKAYPEITPHYLRVFDASSATIGRIEQQLKYPIIVKPASLVSSLLIQSCRSREELQAALTTVFQKLPEVYAQEERSEPAEVIVEEYLEGNFFSIDAYILDANRIFFCPPVAYITAKQLGIDDFFLYKRFVPTDLRDQEVLAAQEVCRKAIVATGLTHSSSHIELIHTSQGWKIIEIGPRLGRFRNTMYQLAYGIDHSLNDLLIHLGQEPIIPMRLLQFCAAYSIYPSSEGKLVRLHGVEQLEQSSSVFALKVFAQPGYQCRFAKNGGKALMEFVVASDMKATFSRLVQYTEKEVKAEVDT